MVNRLTNMLRTNYGSRDVFSRFCKTKIQVYTFGTIRKRSFDDRDFFHTYINYMYYNDISALHMVEIKDRVKLKQTIEDLMFTETLYYKDEENDFVWLLDKLEFELDISKFSPIQYFRTAWDKIHLMYYDYWIQMLRFLAKNGHMDITKQNDSNVTEEIPLRIVVTL